MNTEDDTDTEIQGNDEGPTCAHEHNLMAATYDLVKGMEVIERQMEGKSAEEKLGFLTNLISGVIYGATQVLRIEHWYIHTDDGKVIQITPQVVEVPSKQKAN